MAESEADIEQRGRTFVSPADRERLRRAGEIAKAPIITSTPVAESAEVEFISTDEATDDEVYEEPDRGDGTFPIKAKSQQEKEDENAHAKRMLAEAREKLKS